MDAGDREEGKRPLHPSSGVLWAEIHQPTKKSTPEKRRKFAQVRQAEEGREPRPKPQRHWIDMDRWVKEDQTTINPSYAQEDTYKGQIDTQAQECRNPNLDARESNVSNQQESDQVFVKWGGDFLL